MVHHPYVGLPQSITDIMTHTHKREEKVNVYTSYQLKSEATCMCPLIVQKPSFNDSHNIHYVFCFFFLLRTQNSIQRCRAGKAHMCDCVSEMTVVLR